MSNTLHSKDVTREILFSYSHCNLRFATRLSKKHPNIWSFIQLIQSEHISVQLNAGASAPKQSTKTTAFQMRFDTLHSRFLKKEISANELLSGLSLLIGKKKKIDAFILSILFSLFHFKLIKHNICRSSKR